MPRSVRRSPSPAVCPPWCEAIHAIDPHAVDHTRLAGAVLREPHLESFAVEIEQGVGGRIPRIVLSVFTQDEPAAMNADLTLDEARRAHAALGRALQLAEGPSTPTR